MRHQRIVLVGAAWLAGAVAIATATTVAVNVLGAGLLGPDTHTLSQADVRRQLAQPFASPSVPGQTSTPSPPVSSATPTSSVPPSSVPSSSILPSPAGTTKVLSSAGGTIVARCSGGLVTLVSWSPAQGYRTDNVTRGPAATTMVTFKAGHSELRITITCEAGVPHATVNTDDH